MKTCTVNNKLYVAKEYKILPNEDVCTGCSFFNREGDSDWCEHTSAKAGNCTLLLDQETEKREVWIPGLPNILKRL